MSIPTDRNSFKDYCLRKIGAPVIKINVSQSQVDDRVDEALKFWYDYSMDGTQKIIYKHQVTQPDVDSQSITLPDNIIGAVRIFDIGVITSSIANPFNLNYQIALNDLYTLASSSMIPYYAMMVQLELIEQMLVGQKPMRYNRISNVLYIDMEWAASLMVGTYILVEAYEVVDPEVFSKAFGDRLLQNYATALIKENWAQNIGKFDTPQPGDVKLNFQKIMEEAINDKEKCEQFIMDQNIPQAIFMG